MSCDVTEFSQKECALFVPFVVEQMFEAPGALQITLDYLVNLVVKRDSGGDRTYPYANLFSSYKGDSQLPNVSRNGQYCTLRESFVEDEEKINQYITMLGSQNNVSAFFSRVLKSTKSVSLVASQQFSRSEALIDGCRQFGSTDANFSVLCFRFPRQ